MMILRSAPASPFGRKVKITASLLGLEPQLTVVNADTNDPEDSIRRENPLGKIPTLVLENGTTLYDSRVIVEYLDQLAGGGGILPVEPERRFPALTMQALADGMMDAALLQVYEQRWRSDTAREARWVSHQAEKVRRTLDALIEAPPSGAIDIGHVSVACALGYLDLRFDGSWRQSHAALMPWLDGFSASVPAFEASRVKS